MAHILEAHIHTYSVFDTYTMHAIVYILHLALHMTMYVLPRGKAHEPAHPTSLLDLTKACMWRPVQPNPKLYFMATEHTTEIIRKVRKHFHYFLFLLLCWKDWLKLKEGTCICYLFLILVPKACAVICRAIIRHLLYNSVLFY